MSFQGYLKTILDKTGKTAEEFYELAKKKGLDGKDIKAGQILKWLEEEHGLGKGHGMSLVRSFKFLRDGKPLPKD